MDNIKKVKGINNPYKKLNLVENETVRVEVLKDASKFFGSELKTRKRGKTLVDNAFFKNEKLKELLEKKSITPEENKVIQEQIEQDLVNMQNDLGFKSKADSIKPIKREYKSITGFNIRKNIKEKALIPMGRGAKNFAKAHQLKMVAVAGIIAYSAYGGYADISELKDSQSAASTPILEYQGNVPGNILIMPKTLQGDDYVKFVKHVSNLKLSRELKMDINASEFKDFDKLYGQYMSGIKSKESGTYGAELTKEEGKAFLVMQYIATNTYIDYLKDQQESLKGSSLEKNEYNVASYKNQLNLIEKGCNDLKDNKEGNLERKIKSGSVYFTYYTGMDDTFYVNGLDQKEFKY